MRGTRAPCGALLYPRRSREGLGRRFLDRLTYLEVKAEGDKSMSGKRWPPGGVQGGVPRDPRDMAKAGLLEVQSPVVKRAHPPERRLGPVARHARASVYGSGTFRGAWRRPVRAVKGMSGRPTSCSIRTAGTYRGIA